LDECWTFKGQTKETIHESNLKRERENGTVFWHTKKKLVQGRTMRKGYRLQIVDPKKEKSGKRHA